MEARAEHGGNHRTVTGRIVVGVDGSVPSKAALAWAIRQAKLTGAIVEAVTAWEYGYPAESGGVDLVAQAEQVAIGAIAELAEDARSVRIIPQVLEGNAAEILANESAGAELLVVGSRGHGGFAEMLLGSVGQHCVHHATCPVVVIRDSVNGSGLC